MPVKLRLQRHGKKGKPFFWIVAADARAKRDGKFLDKLGIYNPNTNPATIELDIDGAVKWLENGAQPTDTARAILSYKGALLKKHLAGGVKKGALTEDEAEKKFEAWLEEKEAKITAKKDNLSKEEQEARKKALDAEKEVNAKREAEAKEADAAAAAEAEGAAVTEEGEPEANVEKEVEQETAEEAKTEEKKG
ncbi:SSU ribosomal protein S16P [Salegentibacter sp. 24]|jgi:small subunit ribosomal protein S16|uniref:30S ribosomal protein S16 n=1 Tax=Salegentibacter sp. 24 TaxID=2183986 RepID=UPI0010617909|nr:30S ribosomal protein S16 [Salegentibacter sp. 24]TDN95292.1 SSU ribosomal protein S16P [Salegentibacter sp. 24]